MCIIVTIAQGGELPTEQQLLNCWRTNNDGGGLMVVNEEGKIEIFKSMVKDDFIKGIYDYHAKHITTSPLVIHFRSGFGGGRNLDNTHPFLVHDELGFCHNGYIRGLTPLPTGWNDTRTFNKEVLQELPWGFQDDDTLWELLTKRVDGDKLAFLVGGENPCIRWINREKGWEHKEKQIWYSNRDYDRGPAATLVKRQTWQSQWQKNQQEKLQKEKDSKKAKEAESKVIQLPAHLTCSLCLASHTYSDPIVMADPHSEGRNTPYCSSCLDYINSGYIHTSSH